MSSSLATNVLCIAHRGARSVAPENTLLAARKALEQGADMWELDVGVTADGELIVFHDDSLARTTNAEIVFPDRAPWTFTTFTLAEIKSLDGGSWYVDTDPFGQIAAGQVTAEEQAAMRGEPVPTLREALAFTRDHNWGVNVEIKKLPPPHESFPVVEAVLALMAELDMVDRVLLSSFIHSHLARAKALNPNIETAALVFQAEADPLALLTDLGAQAYHPFYGAIEAEAIRALRQAGFGVNPWTVDDPQDMRRLIQAGVTGIITDSPQTLKQVIRDEGRTTEAN